MPFKDPEKRRQYHRLYMNRRYAEDPEFREKVKAKSLAFSEENPEYRIGYYEENRESILKRNADRNEANPDKRKASWKNSQLKLKYGITLMDFIQMRHEQQGFCAICVQPFGEDEFNCCVDHDHETGVVRALLCQPCNKLLGMARDNTKTLLDAAEYLVAHKNREQNQVLP